MLKKMGTFKVPVKIIVHRKFLVRKDSLVTLKHTVRDLATKPFNKNIGGSIPLVINSQKSQILNPTLQSFTLEGKGNFLLFTDFGKAVFSFV